MQENDIHKILKETWGYDSFRPLQEDIIKNILSGKDTLALLPTGGGKSLCFQVPGLAMDGLTLVVSPLIALMKDQVYNLVRRKISAAAIFSGMSPREISLALDKCAAGKTKFLYISPERLTTAAFRERLERMKISLLAIDEAHCISQWGYDFRPPYLKIAEIRPLLPPDVPVLALTASATKQVQDDILTRLAMREPAIFEKSFSRPNLQYVVENCPTKNQRLLDILQKVPGTAIVYVRSRRRTEEIARWLHSEGFSAESYHAGLPPEVRNARQSAWIANKARVVVCTNAFGMGIDKPDVRLVVHIDLPESLEAYYQEAGRAGRDEKRAFAVMLYHYSDLLDYERKVAEGFPNFSEIWHVYECLCSYLKLPIGAGEMTSYPFELEPFCKTYNLNPAKAHQALALLRQQGFIDLTDAVFTPPRVLILATTTEVYEFLLKNPTYEPLLDYLQRNHTGIYNHFVRLDMDKMTRTTGVDKATLEMQLARLASFELVEYVPANQLPILTMIMPRVDEREFKMKKTFFDQRLEAHRDRTFAMKRYVTTENRCRSLMISEYFGEKNPGQCGKCDVCLKRKRFQLESQAGKEIQAEITKVLQTNPCETAEIFKKLKHRKQEDILQVLGWMLDNEEIRINHEYAFELISE